MQTRIRLGSPLEKAEQERHMSHLKRNPLALALLCCGFVAAGMTGAHLPNAMGAAPVTSSEDQAVLQANGALVRAFERDDTATIDRLLDPNFTWIDPDGVIRYKEEVLLGWPKNATSSGAPSEKTPTASGKNADKATAAKAPKPEAGIWSDAKVTEHVYGQAARQANGQAGADASVEAGVILIARGKTHILRVWLK